MRDPTQRFSDRVQNYVKYRPGYPPELYQYLHMHASLATGDAVADLGSGTGLLSQLFVDRGHRVFAVEPNAEMRAAAERLLASDIHFTSLNGRAEELPLSADSVDFAVAGQAFHWFDPVATKSELRRVLKSGKQVALIWNKRHIQGSPFQQAYEDLLDQFGTDFRQVDQQRTITDEKIAAFFKPNQFAKAEIPNHQVLDSDGLRGRLLSSSYVPAKGEPGHDAMLEALDILFAKFQKNGLIKFDYLTTVYHAQIEP